MTRAALYVALAIASVTGVVFALYPELDLKISALFFGPNGFGAASDWRLVILRDVFMIIVGLLLAPAIGAVCVKLIRPEHRMLIPGRAAVFLISTIILGPLLAANMGLKDHWARARPRDVVEFRGHEKFTPWWDPRGACDVNCSFIAGEASGAFWTVAPAALAPPQWRALAYTAALAFGTGVGLMRMSFGGHFFSDVVFAGALTFIIVWLVHGFLYRWPRRPLADNDVEHWIERVGYALRRPFGARPRPKADPHG